MEDLWPPSGGQTWRLIAQAVDDSRVAFNRACVHLEPWQVVSYTLSVAFLTLWFRRIMKSDRPMTQRIRAAVSFFLLRCLMLSEGVLLQMICLWACLLHSQSVQFHSVSPLDFGVYWF